MTIDVEATADSQWGTNSYLVEDTDTHDAVVIDANMEPEAVIAAARRRITWRGSGARFVEGVASEANPWSRRAQIGRSEAQVNASALSPPSRQGWREAEVRRCPRPRLRA